MGVFQRRFCFSVPIIEYSVYMIETVVMFRREVGNRVPRIGWEDITPANIVKTLLQQN